MTDLATLQRRRDEAEEALHQLQIGRRVAQVRQSDGTTVEYANTNDQISKLQQYVAELSDQIAKKKGNGGPAPIQVWPS